MAEVAPRKRQKTEDAQADGQVYPLPPEVFAIIFSFIHTSDLRYVLLATTVFRDLAYHEIRRRLRTEGWYDWWTGFEIPNWCSVCVWNNGEWNGGRLAWSPSIAATSEPRLREMLVAAPDPHATVREHAHTMYLHAAKAGAAPVLDELEPFTASPNCTSPKLEGLVNDMTALAEAYGHLNVIQWMVGKGYISVHDDILYGTFAARAGQLHVLKWYVGTECVVVKDSVRRLTYETVRLLTYEAARNNQMRVLRWLRDEGAVCDHSECARYAREGANRKTMLFLHDDAPYEHLPCM